MLIDLATPMPREQGTPEWAKEMSQKQQEQLHHAETIAAGPKDMLNDVMTLLDEKTQECRKLYALMKQLDEASK